jgi:hypothetical protein
MKLTADSIKFLDYLGFQPNPVALIGLPWSGKHARILSKAGLVTEVSAGRYQITDAGIDAVTDSDPDRATIDSEQIACERRAGY